MNLMNLNIRHSIKNRLIIEFVYDNLLHEVEPFIYGVSPSGFLGLLAFQIKGQIVNNQSWQLFDLDLAENIKIHSVGFNPKLRADYAQRIKQMKIIYTKI